MKDSDVLSVSPLQAVGRGKKLKSETADPWLRKRCKYGDYTDKANQKPTDKNSVTTGPTVVIDFKGIALKNLANRNEKFYTEKLVTRKEFEQVISEFNLRARDLKETLVGAGCGASMAEGLAQYEALRRAIEDCRPIWSKIMIYGDAKGQGISSDPADHYDRFWRPFVDGGFVYQHLLRDYDPGFLSALNSQVRRSRDPNFERAYRIPTLKDYNTRLATYLDSMFGHDILRLANTLGTRKSNGTKLADLPPAFSKG